MSGLDAALAGTEAVLHAASQDLPCLAELGYRPHQLFDTELAGRLLGYPRVGLGVLVETVLGFTLEKGHAAADWSTRPLPTDWLRYAALDVGGPGRSCATPWRPELAEQGKTEWARQEFAAGARGRPAAPARPVAPHVRHPPRAHSPGLAVVREPWLERDKIAQPARPVPRPVLPDSAIAEAARGAARDHGVDSAAPGPGLGARRHRGVARAVGPGPRPSLSLPGTASPLPEGPRRPPIAGRNGTRWPPSGSRPCAPRSPRSPTSIPCHRHLPPPDVVRRSWAAAGARPARRAVWWPDLLSGHGASRTCGGGQADREATTSRALSGSPATVGTARSRDPAGGQ